MTQSATTYEMSTHNVMTKESIKARIDALSDEMDANEEENRVMQQEINHLYKTLDAMESEPS